MDYIAFTYPRLVLFLKTFERFDGISLTRLNLYREHLVFQLTVIGYEKVYLDIITMLFDIVPCVEIQLMPVSGQHLSDDILIKHTLVHIQLVTEYLLVDLIFKMALFDKTGNKD